MEYLHNLGFVVLLFLSSVVVGAIGFFHLLKVPIPPPTQIVATTSQMIDAAKQPSQTTNAIISWQRPPNASPQSENTPCFTSYAIYDGQVYYGTIPIPEADPSTLVALPVSQCLAYAKDQNHVYIGFDGFGYKVVPGADPNSFAPFYDTSGLILYSKDSRHVYFTENLVALTYRMYISVLANADPSTFVVFYDSTGHFTDYAKDKNRVYYLSDVIPSADPATFVVLRSTYQLIDDANDFAYETPFGKDASHIYYGPNPVVGADVASFVPIYTSDGFWTPYAKDKDYEYCATQFSGYEDIAVLPEANPATFVPDETFDGGSDNLAHDAAHTWQNCTLTS